MSNPAASTVAKTEKAYSVNLLTFSSTKSFDQVISDFEKQLGKLDEGRALSSSDVPGSVGQMEGPSGLMIIGVLQMDRLLPSLTSASTRARQYFVGNPLIASKMAKHNTLAALYAPPRVLIYTDSDKTWIAYDQPSATFGSLDSDDILQTARELDQKFETLVRHSLEAS